MGGIAEGIAGVGAGVAVAMDVQAQNARIRENNQAIKDSFSGVTKMVAMKALDIRKAISNCEKEIKDTEQKLVDLNDSEKLFNKLIINDIRFQISDIGTCTVSADVKLKEKIHIYDDVNAVVDGYIEVEVYDNSTHIGNAKFVLPKYGVNAGNTDKIEGIILDISAKDANKLNAKLKCGKLWAMEE